MSIQNGIYDTDISTLKRHKLLRKKDMVFGIPIINKFLFIKAM